MIELFQVHKTYISEGEEVRVLQGIDLVVPSQSVISIEGASGSGKSTLLNLIGTIDKPTLGEIYIENQKVIFEDTKMIDNFRSHVIGFIFQHYYLLPDFTVLENVLMPLWIKNQKVKSTRNKELIEEAKDILNKVGLSHRLHHYPSQISGGEMARVAVARALVGKKKIILADEPTGNLDKENSLKVVELLWKLHDEYQFTMVLVSHDRDITKEIPNRYQLENGKLYKI
ncbi:MAG: ABC transporter ATP-binding protein [Leptospiraceae bacterium]|nr:ABC transporter ATP-binding protein [Leptospiraceae bacterium]MDW7976502.1 ABC transporter ATP-binding protein [Leptospiraceae bacterium]